MVPEYLKHLVKQEDNHLPEEEQLANQLFQQLRPEIDKHLQTYFEQVNQKVNQQIDKFTKLQQGIQKQQLQLGWIQRIVQRVGQGVGGVRSEFQSQAKEGFKLLQQKLAEQKGQNNDRIKQYFQKFYELVQDLIDQIQYSQNNRDWFQKYKRTYFQRLNRIKEVNEKLFKEEQNYQKFKKLPMVFKNIKNFMTFIQHFQSKINNNEKLVQRLAKVYQINIDTDAKEILLNALRKQNVN